MTVGAPESRLLMSPPEHYALHYLLNPWMSWDEEVDVTRARAQWDALRQAVQSAGASVALLPPGPESGAMTFTRDTAIVLPDKRALVLRNIGHRGDVEPARVSTWLVEQGFTVDELADEHRLDGGNVLRTAHGTWLVGIPPGVGRDSAEALADRVSAATGARCFGVPLASPEFGHLDMVLADLAGRGWLVFRDGLLQPDLDVAPWPELLADRPVVDVDEKAARELACNVVIVGTTVLGGGMTMEIQRALAALDLRPVPLELDEFRKGGGGAHCLTLELAP